MKKKNYLLKSKVVVALLTISIAGFSQQTKLQDNGRPVQVSPVSGADGFKAAVIVLKQLLQLVMVKQVLCLI